jgi:hypothetical protein
VDFNTLSQPRLNLDPASIRGYQILKGIRLLRVDIGVVDYIVGINLNEKSNGTKQKEEIVQLAIAQLEETFSRQNLIMQDVHFQRGCVEMKCDY